MPLACRAGNHRSAPIGSSKPDIGALKGVNPIEKEFRVRSNRLAQVVSVLMMIVSFGCGDDCPRWPYEVDDVSSLIETNDATGHYVDEEMGLPFNYMWSGGQAEGNSAGLMGRLHVDGRCIYVHQGYPDSERKVLVRLPWKETRFDPETNRVGTHSFKLSSSGDLVSGGGGYSHSTKGYESCPADEVFQSWVLKPAEGLDRHNVVPEICEQLEGIKATQPTFSG